MKTPAAVATAGGGGGASLDGVRHENSDRGRGGNMLLVHVLPPEGPQLTLRGREAQTLTLLLERGSRGFTAGEASGLGWARRTSHYVWKLRRRGVPITTTAEETADGRVGRYRLGGRVHVLR